MRKIIFSIFILLLAFMINSEDMINKEWVKVKLRIRKSPNISRLDLAELDTQTLKSINESPIPQEVEPDLAELLQEIIEGSRLYGKENALTAFDILEKKFQNKIHFFNIASDFAYRFPKRNAFVIAKILSGLKGLIEGLYRDNMRALKVIYESCVRPTYVLSDKGGEIEYGTDTVIFHLIDYLREYIKLTEENKIQEDPRSKYLIASIYRDLDLDSQTSNFINIKGARELKEEYFFLNEKK